MGWLRTVSDGPRPSVRLRLALEGSEGPAWRGIVRSEGAETAPEWGMSPFGDHVRAALASGAGTPNPASADELDPAHLEPDEGRHGWTWVGVVFPITDGRQDSWVRLTIDPEFRE